jgi:integrase
LKNSDPPQVGCKKEGARRAPSFCSTGKRRTITVPRFLAEIIGEHIGRYSAGFLFTAAQGGPVRHRNFMRRHFRPAVGGRHDDAAAGGIVTARSPADDENAVAPLPAGLRFHDLRHTCAALLIANSRHLEEVKDYLGHSSIRVTSDRYGHLFPKARAELADSLDATFFAAVPAHLADFSRTRGTVTALPTAHERAPIGL